MVSEIFFVDFFGVEENGIKEINILLLCICFVNFVLDFLKKDELDILLKFFEGKKIIFIEKYGKNIFICSFFSSFFGEFVIIVFEILEESMFCNFSFVLVFLEKKRG